MDIHCLLCRGEKHHVTTRATQSCPIPHFPGRQSHSFGSTGFLLTTDLCSLNLSSRSSERCKHILSAAVAMRGLMRGNERNTQLNSARITNQSQRNSGTIPNTPQMPKMEPAVLSDMQRRCFRWVMNACCGECVKRFSPPTCTFCGRAEQTRTPEPNTCHGNTSALRLCARPRHLEG